MQFNPETGEYQYEAKSTGAEAGIAMANKMGTMDGPLISALEHVPGISQGIGWNAMRGSNTILTGARRNKSAPGAFRSTFSPRHITRLGSTEAAIGDPRTSHYSPFNFLGKAGNAGSNRWVKSQTAKAVGDRSDIFKWAQKKQLVTAGDITAINNGEKAHFAGGGALARVTAASRLGAYSSNPASVLGHKQATSITNFIWKQQGGEHIFNAVNKQNTMARGAAVFGGGSKSPFIVDYNNSKQMSNLMGAAGSRLSQATTGYLAGASGTVDDASKMALTSAAKNSEGVVAQTYLKWAATGERHMALGAGKGLFSGGLKEASKAAGTKGAAKFGLAAGGKMAGNFIPFVNVALWAMTAYDLTKGAAALMGGAVDTARDAFTSFKGSINKPVMGMGFKDNTVAATSRARGVMAIQNSRLNARSVLGNEAAGMAAHFG